AFTISGQHTYLDEGPFTIRVQVADQGGHAATARSGMMALEELLPGGDRGTPNQRFVSELYRDLLSRQVEPGGLAFWSGLLDQGVFHRSVDALGGKVFGDMLAAGASRAEAADLIFKSAEYHLDLVQSIYARDLDRDLDPSGMATWLGLKNRGASDEILLAAILTEPGRQEFFDKTLP